MSDLASEPLESLNAKLAEYQQTLADVEALIEATPDAQDLLKVKSDLEEVIIFFSEFINEREASEQAESASGIQVEPKRAGDSLGDSSAEGKKRMRRIGSGWQATASGQSAESTEFESNGDGSGARGKEGPSEQKLSAAALSLLGRVCLSNGDNNQFGEIVKLGEALSGATAPSSVMVRWFSNQSEELVKTQNVRLVAPLPPNMVKVGTQVLVLYKSDGIWYDGVIERVIDPNTCEVKYIEYPDTEVVSTDRLRPPVAKKQVELVTTPAGYKLPMHLLAKATDSHVQKLAKKKRVAAIKKDQQVRKAEEDAREAQSSWKEHAKKAAKYRAPYSAKGIGPGT